MENNASTIQQGTVANFSSYSEADENGDLVFVHRFELGGQTFSFTANRYLNIANGHHLIFRVTGQTVTAFYNASNGEIFGKKWQALKEVTAGYKTKYHHLTGIVEKKGILSHRARNNSYKGISYHYFKTGEIFLDGEKFSSDTYEAKIVKKNDRVSVLFIEGKNTILALYNHTTGKTSIPPVPKNFITQCCVLVGCVIAAAWFFNMPTALTKINDKIWMYLLAGVASFIGLTMLAAVIYSLRQKKVGRQYISLLMDRINHNI